MVETSAQFISPMGPNMQQPMPPTTVMDLSKNIVQVPTTMVMPTTTTMAPTTDASLLNPQQQLDFQQQQQLQYQLQEQQMQQLPHQQRVNFKPGPPTVFVQPTPNPMASTFRLDTQKMALIKEDQNGILAIGVDPTARNSTLFQASNMLVNGVAPSNQLIDQSINNVKVTLAQNSGMLSEQGMRVVGDVYQVLESLQKFIHAKNGDEKWQRMYRDSSLAGRSAALKGKQQAQLLKTSVLPQLQQPQQYMVEKAKLESKQMMINMRDIIFFIFKSGEFRELLIDFVKLFQSFARRMDVKHGDRLTDSLRSDLLTTGPTTMAPPSATVIQTTQTSEYINIVGPASSATSETILIQNPPSSQPSSSQLKTELTTAAKDTKNILKQESERTRMMEMRLDSLLEKLRSQPQYRDVVRKLFVMYDQFELQFQKHRTMAAQQMQEAAQQNEWNIVFNDAKLIVGDFVGHQPLEVFINQCYQLYMTIKNDPAANQYFRDLRIFILNMMQETRSDVLPSQATIVQPTTLGAQDSSIRLQQHKQQISAFVERGKQLFQAEKSQYYVYFKNMASTMKGMFISLRNDRDRLDVSSKVNKLFKDMFMDEHGRPDLFIMQESIVQLNALFGTLLRQQLVSIQLPFVEGQTRRYAFALHNMVLDINRILPDHFNLQLMNNLDHQSYNMTGEATKNMTKLHFEADSIQFAIRNVHFDVRQLSGLKYHDYGVADIEVLGNRGLSLEANWDIVSTSTKMPHLRLGRVNCNIDKLNIRILAAHHKALDKIVTKLFKGIIRRRVSAMIRQRMQEQLEYITTRFNILLLERQRELKKIVGSRLVSKSKINEKLKMGYEKTKLGKKKGLLLDETTGMRQETQWTQQPQQLQPQLEQQPLQMQPQMMMQPSAMTTTSATVIETVMPTVVMPTANIEQMPSSVAMSTEGYANSQEAVVASTKIGIVKPDMTSAVTTMAPPPPRPLETTMIERASVRSSTPDTILA